MTMPKRRRSADELQGSIYLRSSIFHPVPEWAQQIWVKLLTIEAMVRALDPDIERKLRTIIRIEREDSRKIDAALGLAAGTADHRAISERIDTMSKTIDEALEAVRRASTRTDSIIADRASLKQQLDDALANVKLPADVQEKIDAIFEIEESDAKKIDAALNANVPPADMDPNAGGADEKASKK